MTAGRAAPYPRPRGDDWIADDVLTEGVLPRRVVAWCIDGVLIALLAGTLFVSGIIFGVLTLGLGFSVLHVLPVVPLAYHWLSLVSPLSATPGQRMMDLMVRRDADLGPPDGWEALVSVLAFYATLALGVIWLGVALFTARRRTPHDLLSGLVVVRAARLRDVMLTPPSADWNIGFGGRFNA